MPIFIFAAKSQENIQKVFTKCNTINFITYQTSSGIRSNLHSSKTLGISGLSTVNLLREVKEGQSKEYRMKLKRFHLTR